MADAAQIRSLMAPLRAAMADFSEPSVRNTLGSLISDTATIRLSYPFGEMLGAEFYDRAYAPLFSSIPDLERRDLIEMAGEDRDGALWLGCLGHYVGTFVGPLLDIPPTGHLVHMRFHEFYRIENDLVVEMQAIWDLPELMMQAGAWPMVPSLGREFFVPGPITQDGLAYHDENERQASHDLVIEMLTNLSRHPSEGGPEIMQADRFWHERMNWYGPAGIGSARGIAGFRNWHQIPFLNALPDRRGGTSGSLKSHFFAEGKFVAVTGWPNMQMTVTGDGWLGIAAAGQKITMKSLDFWHVQGGRIRENWVLVDILDVYSQLGVDVLGRMREFNKARIPGRIPFPIGAT